MNVHQSNFEIFLKLSTLSSIVLVLVPDPHALTPVLRVSGHGPIHMGAGRAGPDRDYHRCVRMLALMYL